MQNPVLDFRGFEGRSKDVREAIEEFVARIANFIYEGDGI